MTVRLIAFLVVSLAVAAQAGQSNQNNQNAPVRKVIRTLPTVKLGDTPPQVKAVPGRRLKYDPKPPKMDPYRWMDAPETGTVSRVWGLAKGTNITGSLVKFNATLVVVRYGEDDKEVQIPRKSLDAASQAFVAVFAKEAEAEAIEKWNDERARAAERDAALGPRPVGQ